MDLARRIKPAVVLVDLMMPEMDGLTLLDALRAASLVPPPALIVLSGNDNPETQAEAFEHGAIDSVVKLPSSEEMR